MLESLFYGLAEFLAVFLTGKGTASGSAPFEQGGVFSAESLDFFSGFGEVDVLSGLFGQYLRNADRGGGLCWNTSGPFTDSADSL